MTTSGTTAYSRTVRDVVTTALRQESIVPIDETPQAAEMAECIVHLNAMLKSWQMRGLLWQHETISATVTADTPTVTLPVYVRDVAGVRFQQSATYQRMLGRWERDDFYSLPNRATPGNPTAFYLARTAGAPILHVWPVPTANSTIWLDVDRAMDTVTDEDETLDVPEELFEAIYTNLALRCSPMFAVQPTPELQVRAALLERQALDNYRPSSYFMRPECC